ncbi:MscS family membrane protein [Lebetimonas natsushimae]|uniref:MscS family membrane protein n=1 Tax=Lebetimonas natsushimae TaxID=1936991 RepID=A0A292YBX1_9BACT|nr:mechanosensitive ion channel family protein [Lebetimonas natsushimae]GAX86824.1 MscS family membrane protein [Lebetimonas natsushimae]
MKEIIDILNTTILDTPLYKIILAFLIFFTFLFFRKIFTLFILSFFQKLTVKTKTEIDDKFFNSIKNPLRFLFIIAGIWGFFYILGIKGDFLKHIIRGLLIFDIFWPFYNIVCEFEDFVYHILGKYGKASRELASFLIKLTKVFVIIIGVVAMLQEFGINVTGFIASLGLGGLAFALAAKDTAANLFGGIAILTDNMFKVGEWVKIGNAEGIVEDIGMRTTKIRAFDKRLIVVPNSVIATSNVENFSRRDRRRISMRIGVTYSTSIKNLNNLLNEIRNYLKNHPMIHKEPLLIYFDEYQDSSLSIFCYYFTKTADWEEYLKIKEETNIEIKRIVEKYSSFAFPSQSLYFETPIRVKNEN